MADYWMKLYLEILDDPKMATLPDRLWRRVIELFMVAKRTGQDGKLPDLHQIAWILRIPVDDLRLDLVQIASTGIISETDGGWIVNKFSIRQGPSSDAERKRAQREQERSRKYNGDVTKRDGHCDGQLSRIVRQSTESESDTESDKKESESDKRGAGGGLSSIFAYYQDNFSLITSGISDRLGDFETDYPENWIMDAMKIAVERNKRNLSYVGGILRRWKAEGRGEVTTSGPPGALVINIDPVTNRVIP